MNPPAISKHVKANFKTMLRAAKDGRLAIISALEANTKKPVVLVAAIGDTDDEQFQVVPFAVMIDGNPYEMFEDPTVIEEEKKA